MVNFVSNYVSVHNHCIYFEEDYTNGAVLILKKGKCGVDVR